MTASYRLGQPFGDYLALPGEHFSGLKALDISPLHYRSAVPPEDRSAMRVGRALHALTLAPETAGVAVYPGKVRNGKAWDAFKAAHADGVILTAPEVERVEGMRAAIRRHPYASLLLSSGDGEVTVEWEESGVACKGRIDWLRSCGGIVELKTTRYIELRAFAREFARKLYHVQAAFYRRGKDAAITRRPSRSVPVIVVENVPPHDVVVYKLQEDALEAGSMRVATWLDRVRECRATDSWPGVDGGAECLPLGVPDWALAEGLPEVDMGALEEVA